MRSHQSMDYQPADVSWFAMSISIFTLILVLVYISIGSCPAPAPPRHSRVVKKIIIMPSDHP